MWASEDMSYLPVELHEKILSYLAANQKNLFRCKRVCKEWNETLVHHCVVHLDIFDNGYMLKRSQPLLTTFVNMKSLCVDARDTRMEVPMDYDIQWLTQLNTLSLFNTGLVFTDQAVFLLTNLTKLVCGYHSVITDEGISSLTKLRILRIDSESEISSDCIRLLTNLTEFTCSKGGPITPESVLYLTKLRKLDCGLLQNPISTGLVLHALTNLHSLNLYGNEIVRDNHVSSLVSLTSLNLSSNRRITNEGIRFLTNLRELDISSSHYSRITNKGIRSLTNLTKLTLHSNNKISDKGIRSLTNLTVLKFDAHCTAITKEGIGCLTNLEQLEWYKERIDERDTAIAQKESFLHLTPRQSTFFIGSIWLAVFLLGISCARFLLQNNSSLES